MVIEKYRHPILFYGLSIVVPWILWFIAAYISHIEPSRNLYVILVSILGIIGLSSPLVIACVLMLPDPYLRKDFLNRFVNFNTIKPFYIIVTCFLMITSILLAQGISLLFGYSASQFALSGKSSFSAGFFPAWFLLFFAPILEELA